MKNMDRLFVLKSLMQHRHLKNYLEIGVFNGHIFFRIKSNFKIAVDPDFVFGNGRKAIKLLLNPYNRYNQYFEKTSDDFFAQDGPRLFQNKKIELALIDGMHECDYVIRDVEHTLNHAAPNAVIVLHDCNPLSAEAACSFKEWNYPGTWNGDVWKAILYFRSQRKDLTCFVLDADQGLGIIDKQPATTLLPYDKEQISQFTYQDLALNRAEWLGLQPSDYFYDFFKIGA